LPFALWSPVAATITGPGSNETRDAGGGWVQGAAVQIWSGQLDLVISKQVNESRDESNPGIVTTRIRRFHLLKPVTFQAGATAFKAQDLVTVNGIVYTVQFIWDEYDDLMILEGWVLQ